MLYAVFADDAEAERIARAAVDERLAACVNILAPCRSIYRWEGAVETGAEVPAVFKTSAASADALAARIAELHGYQVPAIVRLPLTAGHRPYLAWVAEQVS